MEKLTAKQLQNKINSIGNRSQTLTTDIHKAGIACIEQAIEHGNMDYATKLVRALEKAKGQRHESVKQWFIENGPFVWRKLKDNNMGFKLDKAEGAKEFDLEHAKEHPFYEKPEVVQVQTMTLEQLQNSIRNLVKKASKKLENQQVDGNVTDFTSYLEVIKEIEVEQTVSQVA